MSESSFQDTAPRTPISEIEHVWPSGVPAIERAYWAVLDEPLRTRGVKLITAFERFEREGSWTDRASEAGLKEPTFFKLLRQWRENRSVSAVVPGLKPRRSRTVGERFPKEALRTIATLVRDDPEAPSNRIAEMVRGHMASAPAQSAMKPVIDRERVALESEMLGRRKGLGRRIVIDTCPILYRSAKTTEWRPAAWAGFVIDVATQRMLGWSASADKTRAFVQAASSALATVSDWQVTKRPELLAEPEFEIGYATDEITHLALFIQLIKMGVAVGSPGDEYSLETKGRAFGSRVVQLLGPRLGPLELHPRLDLAPRHPNDVQEDDERNPLRAAEVVRAFLDQEVAFRSKPNTSSPPSAVDPERVMGVLRLLCGR